jgi:hypothetical protein
VNTVAFDYSEFYEHNDMIVVNLHAGGDWLNAQADIFHHAVKVHVSSSSIYMQCDHCKMPTINTRVDAMLQRVAESNTGNDKATHGWFKSTDSTGCLSGPDDEAAT